MAEKVSALSQQLDDAEFPQVAYRRGASGVPTPVIRGTGIRVQTVVSALHAWKMTPEEIAAEYGLTLSQVQEALAFYAKHRREIDLNIQTEQMLEAAND